MRSQYGERWQAYANSSLSFRGPNDTHLDVQALIRLATDSRHRVLYDALSPQGRNYLHELRELRNRHAHQHEFGERDIERALDTLELFLSTIKAPEAAEIALLRRPPTAATTGALSISHRQVQVSAVAPITGLPESDFVYFATPACGSWTITTEFVASANAIMAHAYNNAGLRMPLVQSLRPGHRILLVYGSDGQYSPIFHCQVCSSPEPVVTRQHAFDVFCYINERFHQRLESEGYVADPVIERFVGISIGSVQDLRGFQLKIKKPKGNNTLRRSQEVFHTAG